MGSMDSEIYSIEEANPDGNVDVYFSRIHLDPRFASHRYTFEDIRSKSGTLLVCYTKSTSIFTRVPDDCRQWI